MYFYFIFAKQGTPSNFISCLTKLQSSYSTSKGIQRSKLNRVHYNHQHLLGTLLNMFEFSNNITPGSNLDLSNIFCNFKIKINYIPLHIFECAKSNKF